jgi:hypothetical protein
MALPTFCLLSTSLGEYQNFDYIVCNVDCGKQRARMIPMEDPLRMEDLMLPQLQHVNPQVG